jgi:hypothetical protein
MRSNLSYYRADVVSYSDYYPPSTSSGQRFGAPMTERTAVVTPTDVRYGFNGKEMDSEGMGEERLKQKSIGFAKIRR